MLAKEAGNSRVSVLWWKTTSKNWSILTMRVIHPAQYLFPIYLHTHERKLS